MEYKSNINVASNIYPRVNDDVKTDPSFVANVRGGLALRELDKRLFDMGSVKLNAVQSEEMRESIACSLARDGQMTHGLVRRNGSIVWECRCEYENCEYGGCRDRNSNRIIYIPRKFDRESTDFTFDISDSNAEILQYEWLGTIEQVFIQPDTTNDLADLVDEPIPQEFTETLANIFGEYIKLDEPTSIIEADISSHILVNAGPGTGKTYTVIERLAHIINGRTVDLSQVLVLCYTNAARDVILKRLDEKGLSAEARQLVICTLDSLAWNNLSEKSDDDLFSLGFNGCIHKFNAEFDADEWIDFEYVIIDEIQDLVNERAWMTLKILSALQCGYLLLGDKCQAIYDYDCNGIDSISSVGFYSQLDTVMPDTVKRYELIGNKRQSTELSRRSDGFREALLGFSIQDANMFFKDEIDILPKNSFIADSFTRLPCGGTTAILTRNNGEAEWVSTLLHKANIRHNFMRNVSPRPSLNRWIADMFWDYREPRISRNDFIERYLIRLKSDEICAISAYDAILSILSCNNGVSLDYVDLREVNQALKKGRNLSPLLTNCPCEELTVSTIHKAKGHEFDHVYLLSEFTPSDESTEEARVWYVGATRPKTLLDPLTQLGIYISKPTQMNRRMITRYMRGRYGNSGVKFCSNIVVGLTSDVNNFSFVNGDLYQALNIQRYLSSCIKVNDTVEIIKDAEIYRIAHNSFEIGTLSPEVTRDFWEAIQKTGNRSNIPPHLTDIYISNIVTVIPSHFPSGVDPMFKESQFWLGVELTGFAKADWHYGGN